MFCFLNSISLESGKKSFKLPKPQNQTQIDGQTKKNKLQASIKLISNHMIPCIM